MNASRCHACGDPCHGTSSHCSKCSAWDNLVMALRSTALGVDDRRLRRALAHLHPRSRSDLCSQGWRVALPR